MESLGKVEVNKQLLTALLRAKNGELEGMGVGWVHSSVLSELKNVSEGKIKWTRNGCEVGDKRRGWEVKLTVETGEKGTKIVFYRKTELPGLRKSRMEEFGAVDLAKHVSMYGFCLYDGQMDLSFTTQRGERRSIKTVKQEDGSWKQATSRFVSEDESANEMVYGKKRVPFQFPDEFRELAAGWKKRFLVVKTD